MVKSLKVEVVGESLSKTKTRVKARNFEIIVDEPQQLGGTDEAPNPVEYLAAALAGCLNVTGNVVASEMGIEIRSMKIQFSGELDLRGFMGEEGVRPGYEWVKVQIEVDSNASKEDLQKWLEEVKRRCPISDNIKNETPVEIELI